MYNFAKALYTVPKALGEIFGRDTITLRKQKRDATKHFVMRGHISQRRGSAIEILSHTHSTDWNCSRPVRHIRDFRHKTKDE